MPKKIIQSATITITEKGDNRIDVELKFTPSIKPDSRCTPAVSAALKALEFIGSLAAKKEEEIDEVV